MTHDEAIKVCTVIQWADGGCSHCVTGLMNSMALVFPDIDWRAAFAARKDDDGGDWLDDSECSS